MARLESKGEAIEETQTHDSVLAVYAADVEAFADLEKIRGAMYRGERICTVQGQPPSTELMAAAGIGPRPAAAPKPKTVVARLRLGDSHPQMLQELVGQRGPGRGGDGGPGGDYYGMICPHCRDAGQVSLRPHALCQSAGAAARRILG